MDRLVEMHLAHQKAEVAPDVEAAWLHHRFTQIHPFQDGNGRVARCLATLVFLRAGWFPLVVTRSDGQYIRACEEADAGSLRALADLFARIEKRAFVNALGLSREVVAAGAPLAEVVSAAVDRVRKRRQVQEVEVSRVFSLAATLFDTALAQLERLQTQLNEALGPLIDGFDAEVRTCRNDGDQRYWFRWQVGQAAQALGYFADTQAYHAWLRLRLRDGAQTELLVSFHGLGQTFSGVLACSVFSFRREELGDDLEPAATGPQLASREVFQLNYRDDAESLNARFSPWLQSALVAALEDWRRHL